MAPKDKPAEGAKESTPPLTIFQAMNAIMTDLGPISKSKENTEQNYKFRGVDAAMDALNPLMSKHGIFPTIADIDTILYETVTSAKGKQGYHLIRKYTFELFALDGSSVKTKAEGEAIDYGDKAVAKCQSVAYREMLYKTFVAPFEASQIDPQGSVDIEDQNHDLIDPNAKKTTTTAPAARAPAPKPAQAPAKPQSFKKITEYGLNINKRIWEDYWIIKLNVKRHEVDAQGQPLWTMENMWDHLDDTVHALFGIERIQDISIDHSRKLETMLKAKLQDIIAEETAQRVAQENGQTRGFQKVVHNQPAPA